MSMDVMTADPVVPEATAPTAPVQPLFETTFMRISLLSGPGMCLVDRLVPPPSVPQRVSLELAARSHDAEYAARFEREWLAGCDADKARFAQVVERFRDTAEFQEVSRLRKQRAEVLARSRPVTDQAAEYDAEAQRAMAAGEDPFPYRQLADEQRAEASRLAKWATELASLLRAAEIKAQQQLRLALEREYIALCADAGRRRQELFVEFFSRIADLLPKMETVVSAFRLKMDDLAREFSLPAEVSTHA